MLARHVSISNPPVKKILCLKEWLRTWMYVYVGRFHTLSIPRFSAVRVGRDDNAYCRTIDWVGALISSPNSLFWGCIGIMVRGVLTT